MTSEPYYGHAPLAEDKAAGEDGELTAEDVSQYFAGSNIGFWRAHERWGLALALISWVTLVVGVVLVGVALAASWQQARTFDRRLIEEVVARLPLLLPGLLFIGLGAIKPFWRWGWELPAFIVALVTLAEMSLFKLGRLQFTLGLFLCALLFIAAGIWLRSAKSREIFDLDDGRLDSWVDDALRRLVVASADEVPLPVGPEEQKWRILRTIPDSESSGSQEAPKCRVGNDDRPRMNPIGLAAFDLRPDTFVILEGTADICKHRMLSTRVHQFAYTDIVAMLWSSDRREDDAARPRLGAIGERIASLGASDERAKANPNPKAGSRTRDRILRHDRFAIRLVGGNTVELLFRDTSLLPKERLSDDRVKAIERSQRIREVWAAITERRDAARRGRANGPHSA